MESAFEWDDANRQHIARHGVTTEDCEHAISNAMVIKEQPEYDEPRWKATGLAAGGRQLDVVWTLRGARYRVITAWWRKKRR